jgi:hypothetical protein
VLSLAVVAVARSCKQQYQSDANGEVTSLRKSFHKATFLKDNRDSVVTDSAMRDPDGIVGAHCAPPRLGTMAQCAPYAFR